MKVLALSGSPRKGGNSETLLASVINGVEEAGAEVVNIRLCDLDFNPCIGCGGCDKTGLCVVDDDMQGLYGQVLESDRIIISSPIYFYSVSAQTKSFIDRCQALWSRKQLLVAQKKWHIPVDRKGFFLSVSATRGPKIFDGAKLCVQYAYDAMGFHYGGDFLVRGVDHRGEMKKDLERLQEAEDFGRNIVLS